MAPKVVFDRRRDIAGFFFLVAACVLFTRFISIPYLPEAAWISILISIVFVVLGTGVWRAAEWARWGAGILAILEAVRYAAALRGVFVNPTYWAAFAVAGVFTLLWAAIALYLLRRSTRSLFAQVRAARTRTHPATS